jgi:uncharacterized membrane protein
MFSNHLDAQQALNKLVGAGFALSQLYVVEDIDCEEMLGDAELKRRIEDIKNNAECERGTGATIIGIMLGAISGSLLGIGLLPIPVVGLVAVGTSMTVLATTLAGAGLGAVICGLGGAITGLEISQDQTRVERKDFWQGKYLVMVDGTADDVYRALSLLRHLYSSQV